MDRLTTSLCFFFVVFISCNKAKVSLEIQPAQAISDVKSHLIQLDKENKVTIEIADGDTVYYKQIQINNKDYRVKLDFNIDVLKSGPLRSYSYDLAQVDYKSVAVDTSNAILNQEQVFPTSDFDNLKAYLDDFYGKGQSKAPFNAVYESSYLYSTNEYDIELERGHRVKNNHFIKIPVTPAYRIASLTFYAKDYDNMMAAEKIIRRSSIKPSEILTINFGPPYNIEPSKSYYYDKLTSSGEKNNIPMYGIKATNHIYEIIGKFLFNSSIIKAKGLLTIKDEFKEIIYQDTLVYDFKKPLEVTNSGVTTFYTNDFNEYTFRTNGSMRVHNAMKQNKTLTTQFNPIAVVFANGEVLK